MIARMGRKKEDLYERKIYYMNHDPGLMSPEEVEEKRDQMSNQIRDILSYDSNDAVLEEEGATEATKFQKFRRFVTRWFLNYGPEDANLPFLYLATPDMSVLFHSMRNSFQV